jgi:hypothetical protein
MASPQDSSLFDSHLLIPFEYAGTGPRLRQLLLSDAELGDFLRNCLLYDQIIIPTVDFSIVVVLASWLGPKNLLQSLRNGQIRFVRYKGAIGYVGNGNGLALFFIKSDGEAARATYHDMTWESPSEVMRRLTAQYSGMAPEVFGRYWPDLTRAVLDAHVETEGHEFDDVAETTYQDVLGNPLLQSTFAVRNKNLRWLQGVEPNQVRWLQAGNMNDEVDFLLRLAQFNFESYMAEKVGAIDQTAGPAAQQVLDARHAKLIGSTNVSQGFTRIQELTKMPDLSAAAADDAALDKLWKIRDGREAQQFRQWFHANVRDKPEEAQTLFYESAVRPTLGDHGAVKTVRFLVCKAAPLVIPEPVTQAIASVGLDLADNFLVGRFLRSTNPKIMIDKVRDAFKAPRS